MTTIYLDASAIAGWSNCREFYRQSQILNRSVWPPNINYHFGIAIHSAVEAFWKGEPQEKVTEVAYDICNHYPTQLLAPAETMKWKQMVAGIPDLIKCYFEQVEYAPENLMWNEQEWSIEYDFLGNRNRVSYSPGGITPVQGTRVILCGRMDRLMVGPRLVDVKTASEIAKAGRPWKKAYKEEKLLDFQFGLYDWYLCQMCKCGHKQSDHYIHEDFCHDKECQCREFESMAPIECYLEVLIKPYPCSQHKPEASEKCNKCKPSRLEKIELSEIISEGQRRRFKQQLAWKISEIVHYVENYGDQYPWPMNGGAACSSKYGFCPFFDLCVYGETPNVMKRIGKREEHLNVRKEAIVKV